ncbi:MAG: hypothetical protein IJS60_01355 [Abditibacteriota bacterium]|nr:hypothetical protein [Abditibacteriota bacterium]
MNCSEYLKQVKDFLDDDKVDRYETDDFACSQDGIIFDNMVEMKKENKEVAKYLNDYFPEICDEFDIDGDINQYKEKIRKIYNEAIAILKGDKDNK